MWTVDERRNKAAIRTSVIFNQGEAKSVLLLPGIDAEDVAEGIRSKVVTKNTNLFLVEKVTTTFQAMQQRVSALERSKVVLINDDLANTDPPQAFDLVSIDLLGNLKANLAMWIKTKLKLASNANFHFTFTKQVRANQFINHTLTLLQQIPEFVSLANDTFSQVPDIKTRQLIALYWILFDLVLLPNHNITYNMHPYSDGTAKMIVLSMTNITKAKPRKLQRQDLKFESVVHKLLRDYSSNADCNDA